MVKVKICGITNIDDAMAAVDFGADALGFVFFKKSPRFIPPKKAASIMKKLPPFVQTVGVFADEPQESLHDIISQTGIEIIQLHGEETPKECSWLGA